MTLRDEIKQFMVACEVMLDTDMNADELNHLEHELLQHYLSKVAKNFHGRIPDRYTRGLGGSLCDQPAMMIWKGR